MELFKNLFGNLLLFVYHCFDRIVINGYLSGLSRPEQVVYFFREIVGASVISKEVLSARTNDYQHWVEAYARNHQIPIEWAQSGVRKEDYVRPALRTMERRDQYGVYFIIKSMEQGNTFRSTAPKYPTSDSNHRIIGKQRSRFTHYYFYLRDQTLGPMLIRVASFFPFQTTYYLNGHSIIEQQLDQRQIKFRKDDNAFLSVSDSQSLQAAADSLSALVIRKRLDYWTFLLGPKFSKRERSSFNLNRFYSISQIEYCRNFIFKRNFPIRRLFVRCCEISLWRMTADKISEVFGFRLTRLLKGKLDSTLHQIEHGHHVFRAHYKNSFVKQYEKSNTFLRNEVCSNNLRDFGLNKGIDNLPSVREKFLEVTDRFASFQAESLNTHADFPLLQRLALPITTGKVKTPGIKIHDTRMIRLMEVLLHAGLTIGGWSAKQIHQTVLTAYDLKAEHYTLNQLRYDLRKLKAHGLLQRDGKRYAYRLSDKGLKVALLFSLFHKRLCGPLAFSLFAHQPDPKVRTDSKLETAYHKADAAISDIIRILKVA